MSSVFMGPVLNGTFGLLAWSLGSEASSHFKISSSDMRAWILLLAPLWLLVACNSDVEPESARSIGKVEKRASALEETRESDSSEWVLAYADFEDMMDGWEQGLSQQLPSDPETHGTGGSDWAIDAEEAAEITKRLRSLEPLFIRTRNGEGRAVVIQRSRSEDLEVADEDLLRTLELIVWPDRYYDTLQHIRQFGQPPPGMHPRVMQPHDR